MAERDPFLDRLEALGLPRVTIDQATAGVRAERWVRRWDGIGDAFAEQGAHTQAFVSYFAAEYRDEDPESRAYRAARVRAEYARMPHDVPVERVDAVVGDRVVAALLQVPRREPAAGADAALPLVVVFPGLGALKEYAHQQAQVLLAAGVAVCRVDLPGHGETTGAVDHDFVGLAAGVVDCVVRDPRIDAARVGAVGYCLGGWFALAAASRGRVGGVTLVSTPADLHAFVRGAPSAMRTAITTGCDRSLDGVQALIRNAGLPMLVRGVDVPVTLHYGALDPIVPPADAQLLAAALGGPVTTYAHEEETHSCPGRLVAILEGAAAAAAQLPNGIATSPRTGNSGTAVM